MTLGLPPHPPVGRSPRRTVHHQRRSWWEVRWRQFRNPPRPVVRAVGANLAVASVLGALYLAYDVALARGARLPGGDLRAPFVVVDVVLVLGLGSLITYFIVPLPRGSGDRATRTGWSAALGLFAAVPIAYLVLVLVSQVLRPLLD